MRRSLKTLLILGSWLIATGLHWDVMQIIAWTRMFSESYQEMSFTEAVEDTFLGEECAMCRTVDEGRHQEQQSPELSTARERLVLIPFDTARIQLSLKPSGSWTKTCPEYALSRSEQPPTPPPRSDRKSA